MVNFELRNEPPMPFVHDLSTRRLFRPPSKLAVCGQAIWTHLKQMKPEPVTLVDLRLNIGPFDYGSSDIYRSARALVARGFAEKTSVSWSAIVKGKERTYHRIALRFPSEDQMVDQNFMTTYSNPYVLGNTAAPPVTYNHNATWPEGLCKDGNGFIWEVRGWDEPHYDLNKRDPATGNVVYTTQQVLSGHEQHAITIEPDASWAYTTGSSGEGNPTKMRARIWRFNLAPGIIFEERRTDFTSAGYAITVYDYGQIPSRPDPADQEPLHSIALAGGSLWVTDAYGGRLLKYDKVSGVQQQVITGLPNARGLTIDGSGNLWVAFNTNQVRSYSSTGMLIATTTLTGVSQIVALSIVGTTMAVAIRTEGVKTYTVSSGILTTQLGSYGQPVRPGDNAPDRLRDVVGMVQLNDGSLIFSDRVGFTGRVQKANGWVHLGIEFTAGATFHPSKPDRVFTSSRNVYSVATNGNWTFSGNGLTEDYYHPKYFGWWQSTHGGPPKLVKHGSNFFFYYPTGASVGIYRVVENSGRGPSLQLCGCICGSGQPGLDGSTTTEPWLDKNRVTWQWTDPVGDGVIRSADQEVISAQDPATYVYLNTVSVDDSGTLWIRELDKDQLIKVPVNSINSVGNPVYKLQDKVVIFTKPQLQSLLGISNEVEFQLASRADGDVYCSCKVKDNPAWPIEGSQWMGANAIICLDPSGAPRWGKHTPFWQIGLAAIDNTGGGGYIAGSNASPGPGTVYHFDKNGNQLKQFRPDAKFGADFNGPNYPSGGLDSFQSLNAMRDSRDGEIKVFAADNVNQRIIVYSIKDGAEVPVIPPVIPPRLPIQISDVEGLQEALDAKSDKGHKHPIPAGETGE